MVYLHPTCPVTPLLSCLRVSAFVPSSHPLLFLHFLTSFPPSHRSTAKTGTASPVPVLDMSPRSPQLVRGGVAVPVSVKCANRLRPVPARPPGSRGGPRPACRALFCAWPSHRCDPLRSFFRLPSISCPTWSPVCEHRRTARWTTFGTDRRRWRCYAARVDELKNLSRGFVPAAM